MGLVLRAWVRINRAVENPVKRIVIGRWNRIELVVVAARASDRQPQERLADVVDRILEHDVPQVVGTDPDAPGNGDVAGANCLLPALAVVVVGQQIAGDLFANELIVRLVFVERIDDVVAVLVSFGDREIA